MKTVGLSAILIVGILLVYGTLDFPDWGDPSSPANRYVSQDYIENALHDISVPNMVTAILADYRGYDTLFETVVIFTASLVCFFILRTKRKAPEARFYRHIPTGITLKIEKGGRLPEGSFEFERIDSIWIPHDLIVRTGCRMVVPFVQLFALYVVAHGHISPGGGFQGGVIFGAAFILYALSHDLREGLSRFNEKTAILLCSTGVFIYAGVGVLCMLLGKNFLDYGALASLLGVESALARSHGILAVEIGVGISVMAVMVSIYYNLSSAGKQDEGL
ncbi:MAG: Na(+)/H(+) antiporter subunit B [Thermodesulfobacteriota bacterium]